MPRLFYLSVFIELSFKTKSRFLKIEFAIRSHDFNPLLYLLFFCFVQSPPASYWRNISNLLLLLRVVVGGLSLQMFVLVRYVQISK